MQQDESSCSGGEEDCNKEGLGFSSEENKEGPQNEHTVVEEPSQEPSSRGKSFIRSEIVPNREPTPQGQLTIESELDPLTGESKSIFGQFNISSDHEEYLKQRSKVSAATINWSSIPTCDSMSDSESSLCGPTTVGKTFVRLWDARKQYKSRSTSTCEEKPINDSAKSASWEFGSSTTTETAELSDDHSISAQRNGRRCNESPTVSWDSAESQEEERHSESTHVCSSSTPQQQTNVDEDVQASSSSGRTTSRKVSSIHRNELRKLLLRRNSSFSAMTCRTLLEMKRAGRLDPNSLPLFHKSVRTKYVCPESWMKRNVIVELSRKMTLSSENKTEDDPEMLVTSTSDRNSSAEASPRGSLSASPDEDAAEGDENTSSFAENCSRGGISPKAVTRRDDTSREVALGETSLNFSFVPDDVLEMQRFYKDDSGEERSCDASDEQLCQLDMTLSQSKPMSRNAEFSSVSGGCSSETPQEQDEIMKESSSQRDDHAHNSRECDAIRMRFLYQDTNAAIKQEHLDMDSDDFNRMMTISKASFPSPCKELDQDAMQSPRCSDVSNESALNNAQHNSEDSENENASPPTVVCKEEPVSEPEDHQPKIFGDPCEMSCEEEIASDNQMLSIDIKTRRDMTLGTYSSGGIPLDDGNRLNHSTGASSLATRAPQKHLTTCNGLSEPFLSENLSCDSTETMEAGDSRVGSPNFSLNPESFTFIMEPLSPQREALDLSMKGKPPSPAHALKFWPPVSIGARSYHSKDTHENERSAHSRIQRSDPGVMNERDQRDRGSWKIPHTARDPKCPSESATDQNSDNHESVSPGRLVIDLSTRSLSAEQLAANCRHPGEEATSLSHKPEDGPGSRSPLPRKPVKSEELNGTYRNVRWRGTPQLFGQSLARSILRWPPVRTGQPWNHFPRAVGAGPRFAAPLSSHHPSWPQLSLSPPPAPSNPGIARPPLWTQPTSSGGRWEDRKGPLPWMRPPTPPLRPATSSSLPHIPSWVRYPIAVSTASIIPPSKGGSARSGSALSMVAQSSSLPSASTVSAGAASSSLSFASRVSGESKSRTGRRATTSVQWRKFSRQYDESRNKTPRGTVHECQCCGRVFSCRSHKERHMLSHTGVKPHPCPICQKGFRRKDDVKIHMLTHTGQRPHECQLCLKRFAHKGTLNKHMLIHSGVKPHKCNVCERSFRRREHLTVHMLTHTGEKPFECHVCHNRYRRRDLLKSHVLAHSGKKHFTCTECSRGFSHKSSLNYHMLTHTGVRPHQCDECQKRFTHKGNLNKHKLIHTKRRESEQNSFEVVCE